MYIPASVLCLPWNFVLLGSAFISKDKECFKVHSIFFTLEFQMFLRWSRESEMHHIVDQCTDEKLCANDHPPLPGNREELYRKDFHDSDNHDGVITHLEADILEPAAPGFPLSSQQHGPAFWSGGLTVLPPSSNAFNGSSIITAESPTSLPGLRRLYKLTPQSAVVWCPSPPL